MGLMAPASADAFASDLSATQRNLAGNVDRTQWRWSTSDVPDDLAWWDATQHDDSENEGE